MRVEGSTDGNIISHISITSNDSNRAENRYGTYRSTGLVPFSVEGYILGFIGRSYDAIYM